MYSMYHKPKILALHYIHIALSTQTKQLNPKKLRAKRGRLTLGAQRSQTNHVTQGSEEVPGTVV